MCPAIHFHQLFHGATLAGAWDEFYVHDAQIVVYTGPDADHNGKEIAFAFSGFSGCHIVDVEDKTDCQTLSSLAGPEFVYPHQGWLTEDQRFVLMNDEMDEAAGIAQQTRTWILDVNDSDPSKTRSSCSATRRRTG